MQPVIVLTDVRPTFSLPPNFTIRSPSDDLPTTKDQWSDLLIHFLEGYFKGESHFVLMLEDYWLVRTVDHKGVSTLGDFARANPEIARIDLTADRMFSGQAVYAGYYGHYDLVETPAPSDYQLSLQAGIWNREHFLTILESGWSSWQTELSGTTVMNDNPYMKVFGTKQTPVRYINALKGGVADKIREEEWQYMPKDHKEKIEEMGWLP
jgi:hypothetical protein